MDNSYDEILDRPEISRLRNRPGHFLRLVTSNATTVWSEDATDVLGYRAHEIIRQNSYDYMNPEAIEIAGQARELLAKFGVCRTILQRQNSERELVWIESEIGVAGKYFYFLSRKLPNDPTPTAGAFRLK